MIARSIYDSAVVLFYGTVPWRSVFSYTVLYRKYII